MNSFLFMRNLIFIVTSFLIFLQPAQGQDTIFTANDGYVKFRSDAPLELIEAESTELRGVIVPTENSFAFRLRINSFEGFNSPLQMVHFNENYLETDLFENATFQGRFIEEVDFLSEDLQMVRAKGDLTIHGVTKERILRGKLQRVGNNLEVECTFPVFFKDHQIRIPRIVHQKISERIEINVNMTLKPTRP